MHLFNSPQYAQKNTLNWKQANSIDSLIDAEVRCKLTSIIVNVMLYVFKLNSMHVCFKEVLPFNQNLNPKHTFFFKMNNKKLILLNN